MDRERLDSATIAIVVVAFPGITALDLVGPVEVLRRLPGATIRYAARDLQPLELTPGMTILPDVTFGSDERPDVILVPGGEGVGGAMQDMQLRSFLQDRAPTASFVASVCTGALVLGAAGLLRDKRATTHWLSLHLLEKLGAHPVAERVVIDGTMITSAGVSAGIDLALTLVQVVGGKDASDIIRLAIEYEPDSSSDLQGLRTARPDLQEQAAEAARETLAERAKIIEAL